VHLFAFKNRGWYVIVSENAIIHSIYHIYIQVITRNLLFNDLKYFIVFKKCLQFCFIRSVLTNFRFVDET